MTLNGTAGSAAILFGAGIPVQTILLSTFVRGKQWLTGALIVEFMDHLNAYAALKVRGGSRIYLDYGESLIYCIQGIYTTKNIPGCMKCEGLFLVITALFGSKHIGIVTGIIEAITLKEASGPAHQF